MFMTLDEIIFGILHTDQQATSRAQLTFDLSFMSDFSLVLPSQEVSRCIVSD